jgi:hypothetical protein
MDEGIVADDADGFFELIEAFDDLLAGLNGDWRLHKELFQDPANYELFSQSSPLIWQMLGDSLVDSVLLSIARLLDPPKSVGKDNLSIAQVLSQLAAGSEREKLASDHNDLRRKSDAALRHWRNKRLSHNDLATLTRIEPLPKITYEEISELIDGINGIGRTIGHVAQGIDKEFVPYVSNSDWVWRLTETLRSGVQQHAARLEQRKKSLEST